MPPSDMSHHYCSMATYSSLTASLAIRATHERFKLWPRLDDVQIAVLLDNPTRLCSHVSHTVLAAVGDISNIKDFTAWYDDAIVQKKDLRSQMQDQAHGAGVEAGKYV